MAASLSRREACRVRRTRIGAIAGSADSNGFSAASSARAGLHSRAEDRIGCNSHRVSGPRDDHCRAWCGQCSAADGSHHLCKQRSFAREPSAIDAAGIDVHRVVEPHGFRNVSVLSSHPRHAATTLQRWDMETTKARVRRTVAEKRRIVELTLRPRASVARVAQAEGVNSHQVFQWRRAYRAGKLVEFEGRASALLPVVLTATDSAQQVQREQAFIPEPKIASGAIHIEFPGRATITVEHGADSAVLRTVLTTFASNDRLQGNPALESLRK